MIRQSLRPLARAIPRQTRSVHTTTHRITSGQSTAAIASLTALITSFGVTAYLREPLLNDQKAPRETVLDSHSLKEPIHKRNARGSYFFLTSPSYPFASCSFRDYWTELLLRKCGREIK